MATRAASLFFLAVALLFPPLNGFTQSLPVRIELRPTGHETSPQGRQLLRYLVSCALPPEVEGHLSVDGEDYSFPGGEGLAPNWANQGMSEGERRYVSACMLARTNALGVRVPIYLVKDAAAISDDRRKAEGAADFTLPEAMYFGDIFADELQMYVCTGAATETSPRDPIYNRRLCAIPKPGQEGMSRPLSTCGFVITGSCRDPAAFTAGGRTWSEVIQVWLTPDSPQK